ncbi:hypothetical protein ACOMHN_025818 [Nucella lapillus]
MNFTLIGSSSSVIIKSGVLTATPRTANTPSPHKRDLDGANLSPFQCSATPRCPCKIYGRQKHELDAASTVIAGSAGTSHCVPTDSGECWYLTVPQQIAGWSAGTSHCVPTDSGECWYLSLCPNR